MKELSQNEFIGKYVHDLRIKNNMTLKQLSEKVDLSPGFLSQMERGYTTFSLNTLMAIASVFDVDLSSFFVKPSEADSEKYIARNCSRSNLRTSKEFEQYSLISQIHSRKMNLEMCNIYPENNDGEEVVFCHPEEEIMFLINGCLEITIEDTVYTLNPFDSIFIPPNAKHSWRNVTNNTVSLLCIHSME